MLPCLFALEVSHGSRHASQSILNTTFPFNRIWVHFGIILNGLNSTIGEHSMKMFPALELDVVNLEESKVMKISCNVSPLNFLLMLSTMKIVIIQFPDSLVRLKKVSLILDWMSFGVWFKIKSRPRQWIILNVTCRHFNSNPSIQYPIISQSISHLVTVLANINSNLMIREPSTSHSNYFEKLQVCWLPTASVG